MDSGTVRSYGPGSGNWTRAARGRNESVVYHCARSADRVPARASTVPQPSSAAVTDGVRSGTGAARLTACVRQKK